MFSPFSSPLVFIRLCFDPPLLGPHAKEEPHHVEMPNKSFVQGDDQNEGSHGDNQEFGHDTQIPGQDKPGNTEDDREMEYVEGQQRLIAIGDYLAFEVQIFGGHTK